MNQHTDSFSLRTVVEKVFVGFAAAAIVAFVSAGTVAICFPTVVA
jgi:hypothetical protein